MSDGSSDLHRGACEEEAYSCFLYYTFVYLDHPIKKNLKLVKKAAEFYDDISRYGTQSKNLEKWLEKLKNKDKDCWIRLLLNSMEKYYYPPDLDHSCSLHDKLKSISIFADKIIISNRYGSNSAFKSYCEFQEELDKYIEKENMVTYDGDDYALIFDKFPTPDIHWLGNRNEKTPYKKDRKKKPFFLT